MFIVIESTQNEEDMILQKVYASPMMSGEKNINHTLVNCQFVIFVVCSCMGVVLIKAQCQSNILILWMQPCRLHTVHLSSLWRLTNESMGQNNASAEPETQQGVFHLSASVICHDWRSRSPCLHKADHPLSNNKQGCLEKKHKKNVPIVLKK